MTDYNQNIGIPLIPGTFPTMKVLNRLKSDNLPNTNWTTSKVQTLYNWYKTAVTKEKLPIFAPNMGASVTIDFIQKNTNYPRVEVGQFLLKLLKLSESGEINPVYWNFKKTPSVFKELNLINPKTIAMMKWGGIITAAGVALYFTLPLFKAAKTFRKVRGLNQRK